MSERYQSSEAASIIRWQFERGEHHVTCAVLATPIASTYEVATVPLWDLNRAAVERFETPSAALHRHAAIAADLRDAGWTLASYTA